VLAQFRDLLGREKARRVTVQQGVEPGGFLQFFNRRTGGRERTAGDHRTVIGQQHGVVLVRNGSHGLSELIVPGPVIRISGSVPIFMT
jgi:hypothetical protein